MIHYFAYGSNLHPIRLLDRVPSARLIGITTLDGHRLTFHKESIDGSSKCNIFATGNTTDVVNGAIYAMAPEHKGALDTIEGRGSGYMDNQIKLIHQEQEYLCFTYQAQQSYIADNLQPYHWYKEMVLLGAGFLAFPEAYVSSIECIESIEDPDGNRSQQQEALLARMREYR